jgi:hypothetical protein
MRPKWWNTADVPLPAQGQTRFGRGTQMRIPGGIHTDTPPPEVGKLGPWVKSIVSQGIQQQERGGRVLVGWARIADTHGDSATATAYRNGALTIATAYAPKKAAADKHYAEMVAAGRAPAGGGGWMADIIASLPQNYEVMATVKHQAVRQGVSGWGQIADAGPVATGQSVMADWEALAAEDPAAGPVRSAIMSSAQLAVAEEAPVGTASPEAVAAGAAKKPGMGLMVALAAGAAAVFVAMR